MSEVVITYIYVYILTAKQESFFISSGRSVSLLKHRSNSVRMARPFMLGGILSSALCDKFNLCSMFNEPMSSGSAYSRLLDKLQSVSELSKQKELGNVVNCCTC